ncbi:CPBP family intramembrane glutamic endopeptidase, partial [Billgrantia kenyensis]
FRGAQEISRWTGHPSIVLRLGLETASSFFIYNNAWHDSICLSTIQNFRGAWKQLFRYLPWVLLFSLTNSFSEEVVYRLGVIVPLYGRIEPGYIMLISAIAFGAPHLRGMPNGLIGAIMAGFLGWLLAKSVIETHGIFWAWFIHFVQDVVIFSAFVMAAANKALQPTMDRDAAPLG